MNAKRAWALMAAGIIFWDMTAKDGELLSEQVDRWLVTRPLTTKFVVAAVSLHLLNALPPRFDPLHLGFAGVRKLKN